MANDKPDSFQCGPFEVAKNPDVRQFVEKLNRLREAIDSCRIQNGVGYTVLRSTNGTVLTINAGNSRGGALEEHPFKTQIKRKNNRDQCLVRYGNINGEDKDISNIDKWIDIQLPARIFLECKIGNGSIQSASIKSQTIDEEFLLSEIEGGENTYARITLAYYKQISETDTNKVLIQSISSDLFAVTACLDGYPAIFLTPYMPTR